MILILSADSGMTNYLRTLLEGQFSPLLLMAKSRDEAIDLASHYPVKVVIVDVGDSPEVYDLLYGILDLREDTSVIILSDPQHRQALIPLIQAGLITYFENPFDPLQLTSRINERLGLHLEEKNALSESTPHPPQEASPQIDFVSMDRLIMDLAHRLKNPLVSIRTFAHLFKERSNDAQFQKDFYQTMRKEVERIDTLIDQLIEFSELPNPSMALHPVLPIVQEALQKTNELFTASKIHLENDLKDKTLAIPVDRDQLIYALIHLLSGLEVTLPKSGHSQILIHLRQATTEPGGVEILLKSSTALSQDKAQFWGLELFMAKRIIERQHGLVQWEVSSEGQPSLRIFLPMSRPASLTSGETEGGLKKHTFTPPVERREQHLPIPFKDRRARERRLYVQPIYFPDRGRSAPATKPS
jgi:DNA-binding NarL/FixJ family response regulator